MVRRSGMIAAIATALAGAVFATPAQAATITAQASAKIIKPLILMRVQDLDFGTVMLGSGSWAGATVSLSRGGVRTCAAQVICSAASRVAIYNVSGTNNMTVRISAPNVTLVNQSDPTRTLTMVVDSPGTVYLTNSGAPGHDFPLGGSIQVNSTTATGTYTGTFNVTVDY